jgi:hypothetical protein
MNNPLSGVDPSGYVSNQITETVAPIDTTGGGSKKYIAEAKEEEQEKIRKLCQKGCNITETDGKLILQASNGNSKQTADYASSVPGSSTSGKSLAQIADHAYGKDGATLPDGVSQVSAEQLENMGLGGTVLNDAESGFQSSLYYDLNAEQYIYAFAGTQDGTDWGANFSQRLGRFSKQYDLAI